MPFKTASFEIDVELLLSEYCALNISSNNVYKSLGLEFANLNISCIFVSATLLCNIV